MGMARRLGTGLLASVGILVPASDLQPGNRAPAFQATDQHGATVRLDDFLGNSIVVLCFYPRDGTPDCTREACSLRDSYQAIRAAGAVVLGVSTDKVARHQAFAAQYTLPFSILADPGGEHIVKPYGVWIPLVRIASRVTFIIDKAGIVRFIVDKVDPEHHDREVLEYLKKLL
jgi:peroxiredoxin Q/BCP